MSKNAIVLVVIIVILVVVGIWYGVSKKPAVAPGPETKEPINIGVIAPLTGNGASWGQSMRQGLELAKDEINKKETNGGTVELIYEDVPLEEVKKAPEAFEKLVNIDKVVGIIGPAGSNVALAVAPLAEQKRIPMIATAAAVKSLTENNQYVFRLWQTTETQAKSTAEIVKKNGYRTIGVLTTLQESTVDFLDRLKKYLGDQIKIAIEEKVDPSQRDFRTALIKINAKNPDAILLNVYTGQVGISARQTKELGINIPLFSYILADSEDELRASEGAMEGIWFPASVGFSNEFAEKFKTKYGKLPVQAAPTAYDALIAIIQVIQSRGINPDYIADGLYSNKFYGSSGEFYFDNEGDVVLPVPIKTIKNGKFVPLEGY